MLFAEAGEPVNPTLSEPFHEFRASYGGIRAAYTVIGDLNQRPALFTIHKADRAVRGETTVNYRLMRRPETRKWLFGIRTTITVVNVIA